MDYVKAVTQHGTCLPGRFFRFLFSDGSDPGHGLEVTWSFFFCSRSENDPNPSESGRFLADLGKICFRNLQRCGAVYISFGSGSGFGSAEPQKSELRLRTQLLHEHTSYLLENKYKIRKLKEWSFSLSSANMIFFYKIFQVFDKIVRSWSRNS